MICFLPHQRWYCLDGVLPFCVNQNVDLFFVAMRACVALLQSACMWLIFLSQVKVCRKCVCVCLSNSACMYMQFVCVCVCMCVCVSERVCVCVCVIIIIIAFKGAIRDLLQSPHSAANRLRHVHSSGLGATMCKSRATHREFIMCKCHVTCHLVRRDSSAVKFDRVEIAFIGALFYWLNH